jgi:chromosome segregation ATPase
MTRTRTHTGTRANFLALGLLALSASLAVLPSCTSAGIAVREQLGIPKRQQLVDRVSEARDAQTQAKTQFASALDEFMAVTGAKGGELETRYRALSKELDRSREQADRVRSRISSVETVGEKLFSEWKVEMQQYQSATLRTQAERQYDATRREYDTLIDRMKAASSKMDPVLAAFGDQVLFLKHNLNAAAIASLQGTASEIQGDVARLVSEMEASISEANAFIEKMQASQAG